MAERATERDAGGWTDEGLAKRLTLMADHGDHLTVGERNACYAAARRLRADSTDEAPERDGFPTKRDAYERAVIALDLLDAIDAKGPQDEAAERWFRRRLRQPEPASSPDQPDSATREAGEPE